MSPFAVTTIEAPKPARQVHVALIELFAAAFADGAATRVEKRPPRSATTAVCAMRLSRDVFIDIDFLSLVVNETFSSTAGKD